MCFQWWYTEVSSQYFFICFFVQPWIFPTELLSFIDPPRITTVLPKEINKNEGQNLQLTCEANGRPKPRVSWKRGETVFNRTRQISSLNFSPLTYKDHGEYRCVAENAGGREEKKVKINVQCKCSVMWLINFKSLMLDVISSN